MAHVSNWQLSDRLGIDDRFTHGDGRSGSGLISDNGRDGGGKKLTCGNGRAGDVYWNLELGQGGDWAVDWTGDEDGNENRNTLARTTQHKSCVKEE